MRGSEAIAAADAGLGDAVRLSCRDGCAVHRILRGQVCVVVGSENDFSAKTRRDWSEWLLGE